MFAFSTRHVSERIYLSEESFATTAVSFRLSEKYLLDLTGERNVKNI